jgi:hypothetical protein
MALRIVVVTLAATGLGLFLTLGVFGPSQPQGPILQRDISATAEAQTFATAQVHRQETRVAGYATGTAYAAASVTAQVEARGTEVAYANVTATAARKATIQAPPTLTAQAKEFEEEEAHAQATVLALEPSMVEVFGPQSGELAHNANDSSVCDDSGVVARNFVAEARFYNPYPIKRGWDYGFVFTNPRDGSQYNVVLDADKSRSVRLQAPGYYVQVRDTTRLIENGAGGSNVLRIYVVGETVHMFINGRFETTVDLRGLDLGQVGVEPHEVMVCTGLMEGDMQAGKSTRYEGFTVWELP